MAKVYAFLADGLEEVECLAAVDVLIRGGVNVTLVSIGDSLKVTGAHGFCMIADQMISETDFEKADGLFLPGGMPGTRNLRACKMLCDELMKADKKGIRIAAICAAPSILGELGLLEGKKATCYPGFEDTLKGAHHVSDGVMTDGTITTARGLGYALDLGLELLELFTDKETAVKIKEAIQYV